MRSYLEQFLQRNFLSKDYITKAEIAFTPLLTHILHLKKVNAKQNTAPLFIGLNGCQGSGKSTLADHLATKLIHQFHLNTLVISLDDFYLSQDQRFNLADNVHPLLKMRGVPGSHDIDLLRNTLAELAKNKGELLIPRFDKANDNPKPVEHWQKVILPVDVVIVEGWCWGTPAQHSADLIKPVNELERYFDRDASWRNYVNKQLKQHYQPLYAHMDLWLMLKAPSFACVQQWRWQQEQKLSLKSPDKKQTKLMNKAEIAHFILYFQRLTEHALQALPSSVDFLFTLDNHRNIN
jgi:D-glycerate 3-kinase